MAAEWCVPVGYVVSVVGGLVVAVVWQTRQLAAANTQVADSVQLLADERGREAERERERAERERDRIAALEAEARSRAVPD